jgi:DNA polymerase
MVGGSQQTLAGDIASAIAWWREAGVDCAFVDDANAWIAPPEIVETAQDGGPAKPAAFVAPPPPPRPRLGGSPDNWPQDLAAFQAWWMEEPSLDGGQVARRVAPRGKAGAALMILVDQCEPQDEDRLLSGPQGNFLRSILSAMAVDEEDTYFSAVLTRHTPLPDWQMMQADGLGELTLHHIKLAAPQRLMVFGGSIPSLLGHDPTQSAQSLRVLNHEGRSIPVLAAHGLDALVRPSAKAALWQRWLDWTGNRVS